MTTAAEQVAENPGEIGQVKVFVNDYAGHPFQIELSNELARRCHSVTHAFCETNITPRGVLAQSDCGPSVVGISTGQGFAKYNIIRRLGAELRYGMKSAWLMRNARPDVCINSNVPIVSLATITVAAWMMRIRNVLWLQDFQAGLVALSTGERHPAARVARLLERWCIRRADHVVTISSEFEQEVRLLVAGDRVTTIPNWAPIGDLPMVEKHNSWAVANGLVDKPVFLYSGTLGLKHRPEALVELARRLNAVAPEALVLVVSESVGVDWIEEQRTTADPLANLRVLPFQAFDDLPNVLGAADVAIALLAADAGELSVPSKVFSYLCAGRPVLGLMPAANAASTLITDQANAGLVAGDMAAFLSAGERLAFDARLRSTMGDNGRAFAEANFDIERITSRFTEVLLPGNRQVV